MKNYILLICVIFLSCSKGTNCIQIKYLGNQDKPLPILNVCNDPKLEIPPHVYRIEISIYNEGLFKFLDTSLLGLELENNDIPLIKISKVNFGDKINVKDTFMLNKKEAYWLFDQIEKQPKLIENYDVSHFISRIKAIND